MLDFYHLPKDFPAPVQLPIDLYDRLAAIEKAFSDDIGDARFIPYLQAHEFEALVFADPTALKEYYPSAEHAKGIAELEKQLEEIGNPEAIDLKNPPSKRIAAAIPTYDKVGAGPLVAMAITLSKLKSACKHFGAWLTRLEALHS